MKEEKKTVPQEDEKKAVLREKITKTAPETETKKESVPEDGCFFGVDFSAIKVDIEEMFKSGVHFGHHKSRKNPKMDEYVFTTRNSINIIDLRKTAEKIKEAMDFVREVAASGQEVLFVGTKKQAKKIVESAGKISSMPYINERWLGGTFTNFPVISSRTRFLREGQEKMEQGEYAKYTKFERMKMAEELERLERKMGGIKHMKRIPGAIIVTGVVEDKIAIKEAQAKNIPIVALVDTNIDPRGIDYVIPANEDAVSALKIMVGYLVKSVLEGKAMVATTPADTSNKSK